MTKYVVSTTLDSSDWHDTTVIGSIAPIADLKAQDGAPIIVAGSRTLVHSLIAEGLVDQLNLQVFPVILGSGDRLYPEGPDRLDLELISSKATGTGVILQSYVPKAA
jgi:dihydrofolate reductase